MSTGCPPASWERGCRASLGIASQPSRGGRGFSWSRTTSAPMACGGAARLSALGRAQGGGGTLGGREVGLLSDP